MARTQKQSGIGAAVAESGGVMPPASKPGPLRWRLKDKAPPHYIQGQGIFSAGEEFIWPAKVSDWCVLISGGEVAADQPEPVAVVEAAAEPVAEAKPAEQPAASENPEPGTF